MILRGLVLPVLCICASMLFPAPARAACSLLSECSCTVTATGVSFGNYDSVGTADKDATGSVRVRCTLLIAIAGSFRIDLSTGGSGSYAPRRMQGPSGTLPYNLYADPLHLQVWGTGATQGVTRVFLALLAIDDTTTIYGRIPGGQNVGAGSYGDTITVTVTY